MKVVIVGFKVANENSTFYRKLDYIRYDQSVEKLLNALESAIEKSDFISIRVNRETDKESKE